MEEADAPVQAGEAASSRDEDAVVDGGGGEHGEDGEDGHGARRDLEVLGEVPVHGFGLFEGECVLLGIGRDEEYARGPYWAHPDYRLQFLHSMNCV